MKQKKNNDTKKKKPAGISLLSIQTNFFVKQKQNNIATNYKEVSLQMNHIKAGGESTLGALNSKTKMSNTKQQTLKTSIHSKYLTNLTSNAINMNNTNITNIPGNSSLTVTNKMNSQKISFVRTSHSIVNSMNSFNNNNNNVNNSNSINNSKPQITNKTHLIGITSTLLNNYKRRGSYVVTNNNKINIKCNNNTNTISKASLLVNTNNNNNNKCANINNHNHKYKSKISKCSINSIYVKLNDILSKPTNSFIKQMNTTGNVYTNGNVINKRKDSKKTLKKDKLLGIACTKTKEINLFDEGVHNKNKPKKITPKITQQRNNLSITHCMKYSITDLNNTSNNTTSINNNTNANLSTINPNTILPKQIINEKNISIISNPLPLRPSSQNFPRKQSNPSSIIKFSLNSLIEENKQNLLNEKANHTKNIKPFAGAKKNTCFSEYDLSYVLNNSNTDLNKPPLPEMDTFEDLNSIVRKLTVDKVDINKQSIFSVDNNHIYQQYKHEFDLRFNAKFPPQSKNSASKLINTSHSTQENSNKKPTYKNVI